MNPKRSVYHHPGRRFLSHAKSVVFFTGALMNDSVYHQIQSSTQPYLLLQMSRVHTKGVDRSVYQQIVSLELQVGAYKRKCGDGICPCAKSTPFLERRLDAVFYRACRNCLSQPGGVPRIFETLCVALHYLHRVF